MFGFDRMPNELRRTEKFLLSEQALQGDMLSAPFSSGENRVLAVVFPQSSENCVVQDWATHTIYSI
jgi:hypothetical protein